MDSSELKTHMLHELQQAIEAAGLPAAAGIASSLEDGLHFVRGFPVDDPGFYLPTVSIDDSQTLELVPCAPHIVDEQDVDADHVDVTIETGRATLPAQVDLWTSSKTQRAELLEPLRDLFQPDLDVQSLAWQSAGLEVTLTGHEGAPCRWQITQEPQTDEQYTGESMYRHTLELEGSAKRRKVYRLEKAEFTTNNTFG